ncbi:hypothetical protein ACN38_g12747, partial [Penicillium nordicum]
TAQIVEIAGFVILERQRVLNISHFTHTVQYASFLSNTIDWTLHFTIRPTPTVMSPVRTE